MNKRVKKKKAKQDEERMLRFVIPIMDPYGNSEMTYKQKMKYLKEHRIPHHIDPLQT